MSEDKTCIDCSATIKENDYYASYGGGEDGEIITRCEGCYLKKLLPPTPPASDAVARELLKKAEDFIEGIVENEDNDDLPPLLWAEAKVLLDEIRESQLNPKDVQKNMRKDEE